MIPRDRTISQEFKNLVTKLDEQQAYVDGIFNHTDERLTKMDAAVHALHATVKNANATTCWSQIEPVGAFRASGQSGMRYEMPSWFPDTVRKFW
jgi:hypothetical protein